MVPYADPFATTWTDELTICILRPISVPLPVSWFDTALDFVTRAVNDIPRQRQEAQARYEAIRSGDYIPPPIADRSPPSSDDDLTVC